MSDAAPASEAATPAPAAVVVVESAPDAATATTPAPAAEAAAEPAAAAPASTPEDSTAEAEPAPGAVAAVHSGRDNSLRKRLEQQKLAAKKNDSKAEAAVQPPATDSTPAATAPAPAVQAAAATTASVPAKADEKASAPAPAAAAAAAAPAPAPAAKSSAVEKKSSGTGALVIPSVKLSSYVPKPAYLIAIVLTLVSLLLALQVGVSTNPFFTLCIVLGLGYVYSERESLTLATFVRTLFSICVKIFFRDLTHSGTHRIPERGPVLFVCAPHANQFVDPILVLECAGRPVGFLSAAKSMRRKFVGAFARALGSIPVERAQDIAAKCTGQITSKGNIITGTGTKFLTELKPGFVVFQGNNENPVVAVKSDTEAVMAKAMEKDIEKPASFKAAPKVDQGEVFESVWTNLRDGGAVGIFPEGGSHDRPSLMELKAGVCIMALGAMAKYPEQTKDLVIIPVGLNYFNGHRFRGRAYVDFGKPIIIPQSLVRMYREASVPNCSKEAASGKRESCSKLLELIHAGLRSVTVNAPSWEQMETMWAIRRLYKPQGIKLSAEDKLELERRFEEGAEKLKHHPKVAAFQTKVSTYLTNLKSHGIRDHQVNKMHTGGGRAGFLLAWRIIKLIAYASVALPGLLINAPCIIAARKISEQKRVEALASSNVKLYGRDVLATWKLMVAMVVIPIMSFVYALLAAAVGSWMGWGALRSALVWSICQPFVSYLSIRFVEVGRDVLASLRPLLLSLLISTYGEQLRNERNSLKDELRALVTELGPAVYGADFEKKRLIQPNMIRRMSGAGLQAYTGPKHDPHADALFGAMEEF